MSKKKKNRAPLDGFVQYYAFKAEEAKMKREAILTMIDNVGHSEVREKIPEQKSPDVHKTFKQYTVDKHFSKGAELISFEEYVSIPWLNDIPEIVCDVLCYLTNYFHHRSDIISKEAYKNMLMG